MRRILLAALFLSACTKAEAEAPVTPPAPPPKPAPLNAQQMFDRELPDSVGDEFVSLGSRRIKVEAAGPVKVTPDDAKHQVELSLPLGTVIPVQCYVYTVPINTGATVSGVMKRVAEKLTVESLQVSTIEVLEQSAALFAELRYQVDSPEGKKLGQLKLAVFPDVATPVFCLHDEPGYLKTFQRVTTRLATVLARSGPPYASTTYRTVSVTSLEGRPVGFDTVRYFKGDDGGRRIVTTSALLLPRSRSEWMTQDSMTISEVDAEGVISSRRTIAVANGEPSLDMTVTHAGASRYTFTGTTSGKALSGSFKTKSRRGLDSDVLLSRAVKNELMLSKVKQLEVEQYLPDVAPTAVTMFIMRRVPSGPRNVEMEMGPLKILATVDANGDSETTDMPIGPITLHSVRKFVEGTPE